ncbi:hypothetical protein ACHAWO_009627 [Cyclotella atomus]|uniref:Uncharacterized protein n=1 Tax=Cyclotella atomus TaxID=382360 RepID=A0ABD3N022_9STRA
MPTRQCSSSTYIKDTMVVRQRPLPNELGPQAMQRHLAPSSPPTPNPSIKSAHAASLASKPEASPTKVRFPQKGPRGSHKLLAVSVVMLCLPNYLCVLSVELSRYDALAIHD